MDKLYFLINGYGILYKFVTKMLPRNACIVAMAVMIVCSAQALAQTPSEDGIEMQQIRLINHSLAEGNCADAQKYYNTWKVLTGTTNSDIENSLAECVAAAQRSKLTFSVKGVDFDMVFVVGGSYFFGLPATGPVEGRNYDEVSVGSFYIGATEVTQKLWRAVLGDNPSSNIGDNLPVEDMTYDDIVLRFLPELNRITGRTFVLPTEAEWEWAARGGRKSRNFIYSGGDHIPDVAWYYDNSGNVSHPVAQGKANELGLYDMSGNVWEWCSDWYYDRSDAAPGRKVARGGCWHYSPKGCRIIYRDGFYTNRYYRDGGFRLLLKQ